MTRELVLPPDFEDYAWEVEAKGVFWAAAVRVGESVVPVIFYDPTRLAHDVEAELADRSSLAFARLLVIPTVTEEQMRAAISSAPADFFD